MLLTGMQYMVIGMTVVFCFLGLLVLILRGVSAVARRMSESASVVRGRRSDGTVRGRERIAAAIAAVSARTATEERRVG